MGNSAPENREVEIYRSRMRGFFALSRLFRDIENFISSFLQKGTGKGNAWSMV